MLKLPGKEFTITMTEMLRVPKGKVNNIQDQGLISAEKWEL